MIAHALTPTNARLIHAFRDLGVQATLSAPDVAASQANVVGLGRLDVRPTLDGIEPGFSALRRLERDGLVLLNRTATLYRCHDKLATALALAAAGVRHPVTAHVGQADELPAIDYPVVVKPRFGSWGEDVALCRDRTDLRRHLRSISSRRWFALQGALLQEYIPARRDLRLVVARGHVVGAAARIAARGEWRTNVCKGANRFHVAPPAEATAVALAAAEAVEGDLVGIDLLPVTDGYVVLEVNGTVDFTPDYAPPGADVFARVAERLATAANSLRREEATT